MPITNTEIVDVVSVQPDGSRRGTVDLTFADGRVFRRHLRAADAARWANLLLDIVAEQEAKVAQDDADEASETDNEIAPVKEAGIKFVAVAYLRKAYQIEDPYLAYLKFERFNTYRNAQGWNLNQIAVKLSTAGLTSEEWTDMKDRYVYLSEAGRVTAMVAYQAVLDGDVWV